MKVEAEDAHCREIVVESMPQVMAQDPMRFLEELSRRFHSDYFFATELHDDESCPFAKGSRTPFEQPARIPQSLAF